MVTAIIMLALVLATWLVWKLDERMYPSKISTQTYPQAGDTYVESFWGHDVGGEA